MKSKQIQYTDILVIGSGLAGLVYALKMAKANKHCIITIISKTSLQENNTQYAQGGIAATLEKDSSAIAQHIEDTVKAGRGMCNPYIVQKVITDSAQCIQDLIQWGVPFEQDKQGKFYLGLEGGHSTSRILHCKDTTGKKIIQQLIYQIKKYPNIKISTYQSVIDLIIYEEQCIGAMLYNQNKNSCYALIAKNILLATGGCGQVYQYTTNPIHATGDGIAIAHRAGVAIKYMEYIQFHPTAFYQKNKKKLFLITEALRGEGAYILDEKKQRFLYFFDKNAELATRDVIAQAMSKVLQNQNQEHLWLDCRHMSLNMLKKRFPTIINYLFENDINPQKQLIPIIPAAHYQCGGIAVDEYGVTNIKNLYSSGEVAYTGLHGVNRLASNSLLEAVAFAKYCFEHTIHKNNNHFPKNFTLNIPKVCTSFTVDVKKIIEKIQNTMQENAGIIYNPITRKKAKKIIDKQVALLNNYNNTNEFFVRLHTAKNICTTAQKILKKE